MAVTIKDIREAYPQYNEVSDADLASALHQKFYSDVPKEQFDSAFMPKAADAELRERQSDMENLVDDTVVNLGYGFTRAGQGVKQSWLMVQEALGNAPEGTAQKYTDRINQENAEFESLDVAQGDYAGFMQGVGEFAPAIAVPAPAAVFKGASLATKIGAEAMAGSVFGHTMYQESLEDKAKSAAIGTALGAGVTATLGGAAKGIQKLDDASKKRVVRKVQEHVTKLKAEGYSTATSFNRAWKAVDRDTRKRILPEIAAQGGRHKVFNEETLTKVRENMVNRWGGRHYQLNEASSKVRKSIADALMPIAPRLEEMGLPKMANALRRLDMELQTSVADRLLIKDSFDTQWKRLKKASPDKARTLKRALYNGDRTEVIGVLRSITDDLGTLGDDITASVMKVDELMQTMRTQAKSVGYSMGKAHPNFFYFPRELNDYKKFAFKRGVNLSSTNVKQAFADAFNAKFGYKGTAKMTGKDINDDFIRQSFDPEEVADILQDYAGRFISKAEDISTKTKHGAKRRFDAIPERYIDDYADPTVGLTNQIIQGTHKFHNANFFGGRQLGKALDRLRKEGKAPTQTHLTSAMIGDMVGELHSKGKILGNDVEDVIDILRARFVGGSSSPNKVLSGTRNVLYTTTLGNPFAAATQLADLGAAAYMNGPIRAIRAMVSQLSGKQPKLMDKLGLDAIAHEAEHLSFTARGLDKALRWSGFKAVDRFGKETLLRSSLSKMKKTSEKVLRNKYKNSFTPKEMDDFIAATKAGDVDNPYVKQALWTELANIQPIALSEMPKLYLQHPNLRLFYMLKTFTIKQLDLLRRDVYKQARQGNVVQAATNMTKLAMYLGVSNATVEQVKNYINGKPMDPADTALDAVAASLLRNYGMSQWTLDKIRQGKPIEATIEYAMPPIGILQHPVQDLIDSGKKMRTLKDVPVGGKILHNMFYNEDSPMNVN